ncbi:MAG: hypothetical protein ACK5WQ_07380 [Alphaproteobacteria bacterium]
MSIVDAIDNSPLAKALNGVLEFPGVVFGAAAEGLTKIPAALGALSESLERAADATTPSIHPVASSEPHAVDNTEDRCAAALKGFDFAGLSCVKPDNIQDVSGQNLGELALVTQGTPQRSAEEFFGLRA